MAYSKQTWATGDTITAAKLNHMEDGIASKGGNYQFTLTYDDNGLVSVFGIPVADAITMFQNNVPVMELDISIQVQSTDSTYKQFNVYGVGLDVTDGVSTICLNNGIGLVENGTLANGGTWSYNSETGEYVISNS